MNKKPFLSASDTVDYYHPAIARLAATLLTASPAGTARQCFEWVRDNIQHCMDFKREETPYIASDVLAAGTGFCTAKSHLLVALLRANQLPAGFCYQRLTLTARIRHIVCTASSPSGWRVMAGIVAMPGEIQDRESIANLRPETKRLPTRFSIRVNAPTLKSGPSHGRN